MKRSEFLEVLVEAIEVESEVDENTVLANVGEWDSLAAVTVLALFNKKLGLKVTATDVQACRKISDLLDLGNSKYE